ncbi:MAG: leucine-rich repeat domain-containing protein [Erysipelotrichaceae bacterium]|nr:leucine-rich repeat domain-containing protein [Erysipelotrichaceae bacterium]
MKLFTKFHLILCILLAMIIPVSANDRGTYIPNNDSGIPDPALYEFIKIQTGQSEVYSQDLVGVEELTLSDRVYSIRSLQGLSQMDLSSLHTLTLDISTLATLEDVLPLNMLQTLRITNSSLEALPENINELSSLRSFELYDSKITQLPDNFYDLGTLESLYFERVPLKDISKDILKLQFLDSFTVVDMDVKLPEELYSLMHLKKLRLSGMKLNKVSSNIINLYNLEELSLDNNEFTEIPQIIYELASLQKLSFRQNQIKEISKDIEGLARLKELDLSYNQLIDLPIQITNLNDLRVLGVRDNQFECLPSDFSLLQLTGVYDFFEYNEIAKCEVPMITTPAIEIKLSVAGNIVSAGGHTNQSVVVLASYPVYFMVNGKTETELGQSITISSEGMYTVQAIDGERGPVDSLSFTIDKTIPTIRMQGDTTSSEYLSEVAIESDEDGYFVVNGVKQTELKKMIVLDAVGNYQIYQMDRAGNESNTITFAILEGDLQTRVQNNGIPYWVYIAFALIMVITAWGVHVFLLKGSVIER